MFSMKWPTIDRSRQERIKERIRKAAKEKTKNQKENENGT